MKKILNLSLAAALAATTLVSCKEDEKPVNNPDIPTVTNGAFILTQGNAYDKIEGGLNYLDYGTGKMSLKVFSAVNGRSLGDTPQCGISYGSKVYIGVEESNTIEIIDRNTFKSLRQISLVNETGQKPRSMAAKDGKVYISMFNGYVARLDTLTGSIDATVKVGPNPDRIAIQGHFLYVPNSDGMSWNTTGYGRTASMVDLDTFKETKTFEVPKNPETFYSNGIDLFLLCKGDYETEKSSIYRIDPMTQKYEKVTDATMAALTSNTLYIINAPNASDKTFKKIDLATGATSDMLQDSSEVIFPSGFAVDPISGRIFIGSHYLSEWGYGDYNSPGFLMEYDINGRKLNRYNDITPGPAHIFFSAN